MTAATLQSEIKRRMVADKRSPESMSWDLSQRGIRIPANSIRYHLKCPGPGWDRLRILAEEVGLQVRVG